MHSIVNITLCKRPMRTSASLNTRESNTFKQRKIAAHQRQLEPSTIRIRMKILFMWISLTQSMDQVRNRNQSKLILRLYTMVDKRDFLRMLNHRLLIIASMQILVKRSAHLTVLEQTNVQRLKSYMMQILIVTRTQLMVAIKPSSYQSFSHAKSTSLLTNASGMSTLQSKQVRKFIK